MRRADPGRLTGRWWTAGVVALAIACGVVLVRAVAGGGDEIDTAPASPAGAYESEAPNVVVVMTDDQALDMMAAMPLTRRLIDARGTTFDRHPGRG